MLNHRDEVNIEEIFGGDLRPEARRLLHDNKSEHIVFLQDILKKDVSIRARLQLLTEYGLTQAKNTGTDFELASYFFILSEIKNIHSDVRSFFIDMMIFCEEDEYTMPKNISEIKNYYKEKILPLL